jgi:1-deoxy-D-xylulose-5-phosphate reductoisomerase
MGEPIRLAILGSTGSIGRQTLEVAALFPDLLKVVGLAAGSRTDILQEQIRLYHPSVVAVAQPGLRPEVDHPHVLVGAEGLIELCTRPDIDMVVVATSGSAGLRPTLAALEAGKELALANKEVLVMAGGLVMSAAARRGIQIRPMDSEHSAIWQCLQGEDWQHPGQRTVRKLILTASGGPFRELTADQLREVTAEEALRHPIWRMGSKVTIDSATLMNKGLEVIEAMWLFDLRPEDIEVVIHPQGIVHSLVEFVDGSIKAQLGAPDMRLPIQYALLFPHRRPNPFPKVDMKALGSLAFYPPDTRRFPCLQLAYEAARLGRTYPAVLSSADEVAVTLFLEGRIGFTDIPALLEHVLTRHVPIEADTLESILASGEWARREALAASATLVRR